MDKLLNKMEKQLYQVKLELSTLGQKYDEYDARRGNLTSRELKEAQNVVKDYNYLVDRKHQLIYDMELYERALTLSEEEKNKIVEDLSSKYGISKASSDIVKSFDNEDKSKSVKPGVGYAIKWMAMGAATLCVLGFGIKKCSDSNILNLDALTMSMTDKDKDKEEKDLVLGEYGTLLDATDDAQVEARAKYIYENYFKGMLNTVESKKTGTVYSEQCTIENLSNLIRMRNKVLPKENGEYVYRDDTAMLNYYSQMYNELFCNMPANTDYFDKIQFVPSSLLLIDGSDEERFTKVFDEDYKRIADARNGENYEESVNAIKALGEDLRDRLLLRGLDGSLTPWNLDGNQYAAVQDAMRRYSAYVVSWNLKNKRAVCIPVCTNYKTGKLEEWPVTKIYEYIEDGLYNDVIAYMTGEEPNEEPIGVQFFYSEHSRFLEQYQNIKGLSYTYKK